MVFLYFIIAGVCSRGVRVTGASRARLRGSGSGSSGGGVRLGENGRGEFDYLVEFGY